MPDYEYDIFISYRRSNADWVRWTKENFTRALDGVLRPSLGNIRVFVDEELETGVSWPISLAAKLARSRLLVPILSRDYFQSEWCRLELALMLHREKACQLRCLGKPHGIVIPVVIDDGDCFPAEVQAIKPRSLHSFANPFMRPDSPRQEALAEELMKICSHIEHAHKECPKFDQGWEQIVYDNFREVFKIAIPTQETVPQLVLRRQP